VEVVEYYLAYLGKLVGEGDKLMVKGGFIIYSPFITKAVTQLNAVAVALA
jgi:fructose-1,6-bisphosphatase